MMKKIAITLITTSLLILHSCRPEPIPIQINPAPQKLVVASQVVPGNLMIIALSKSFGALTYTDTNPGSDLLSQLLVTKARVTISYNGITDTLYKLTDGFYASINSPFTANTEYTLRVFDSASGLSAQATTRMLPSASPDSVWTSTELRSGDTFRYINVRFSDPTGNNYYMVNLYRNTDFVRNTITNPTSVFGNFGNDGTRTLALSDALFDKQMHTEKINIDDYQKGDTLTVTLSNISADYYEYLIQKARSERNGLGAIFGEPVNFTSNVRGGYGFFTAHWPTARVVIIEQ